MRKPKVYWRTLRREWSRDGWEPTDTGWLLSLTIVVIILRTGLIEDCSSDGCSSKFEQFLKLKPSEMGDTLAGFFSALAFIWIIVTVFIQSRELREQRNEFREQRLATQDMAKSMAAQARLYADEEMRRSEERYDEVLGERMKLFLDMATYYRRQLSFTFEVSDCGVSARGEVITLYDKDPTRGKIHLFPPKSTELDPEEALQGLVGDLHYVCWTLDP